MSGDDLRRQLAAMVAEASDGEVPAADALAGTAPLPQLGMTSLALLRLVDAVEARYGVEIDLADPAALDSVAGLADHLAARGAPVEAG